MIKSLLVAVAIFTSAPAMAAEINVFPRLHMLTLTLDSGEVKTYSVGVSRTGGNAQRGTYTVERKRLNPSWTPTPNMLKGKASYTVPPGKHNPLGAAKLYLSGPQKYIGIHGTNDESSVGHNVSHGCFRMHKQDILELYNLTPVGTRVTVQ